MLTYPDIGGNGGGVAFTQRNRSIHLFTTVESGPEALVLPGSFNISLSGTFVGSFKIQRSYDGENWLNMTALGTDITFTDECEEVFSEPEIGVVYRWNCLSLLSGAAVGRISQ